MKNLLEQVKEAGTRTQKQQLAAQFISALPHFLKEFGVLEQKYNTLLRKCVDSEGSKSGGLLLIEECDLHREYTYERRLYEATKTAISVLNMYTGEK